MSKVCCNMAFYMISLMLTLWPLNATSHSLNHEVIKSEENVTVSYFFQENERPYFEPYEVNGPKSEQPFQIGQVNQLGEVNFRPDSAGVWRVVVTTADGHRNEAKIKVDHDGAIEALSANGSRIDRIIAGIGYIFGVFGAIALWRFKRLR